MNLKPNSTINRIAWVVVLGLAVLSGIFNMTSCGNKNTVPVAPSQGMNYSVSMQTSGAAKAALLGVASNEVYYNITGSGMAPVTGVSGPITTSGNTGIINLSITIPQGTSRLLAFQINDASNHQPLAIGAVQSDISAQPTSQIVIEMGSIVRNCYNQNTAAFADGSYFGFQNEHLTDAAAIGAPPYPGYDIDFIPVAGIFQMNALNGDTVAYMGNGNLVNFAMAPTTGYVANSVAAKQAAGAATTTLQAGDVFCVYLGTGNGHAWMQVINVGSATVGPTFEFRLNTSLPYYAYQQTAADIVGPCATIVPTSTSTTTNTITSTSTNTPIFTYTFTSTFTITPTNTLTNTPTLTDTSTVTNTPTNTATNTVTSTATNTATITDTPLTNNGVVSTLAGSGTAGSANGTGPGAQFNTPNGVAVDSNGYVYVADYSNDDIREIGAGTIVSLLAGQVGVTGSANGTDSTSSFFEPTGVAVNSAGTTIYVADYVNDLIRVITAGNVTTLAGTGSAGSANGTGTAASFANPFGVAVDTAGNVYVADTNNSLIRKITSGGVVTTMAGSGTEGSANGIGTAAQFTLPTGIAVDFAGNLYVADSGNNMIRLITPGGVVTTLAGQTTAGSANGIGIAASFNGARAIAIDSSEYVYVADTNNNMIRLITPGGVVTTLAGQTTAGSANGTGTSASFNNPQGIAVDSNGHVYVGDSNNNMVREIQ